ncbi:MAG: SGNH/GDSL hydrolase family protein [Polyangiales bacterium]
MRASILSIVLCLSAACSESGPPLEPMDASLMDAGLADASVDASGLDAGPAPQGLFVRVYTDEGEDNRTRRRFGFDPSNDTPLAGQSVRAISMNGDTEAVTGPDGIARFDDLATGTYLFDSGETSATTHNVAPHLVEAVDGGSLRMVTFGDSLPVFGGRPRFDAVLASRLNMITDVESTNIAVSGSTSLEWGVGARYYERLQDEIAGTDLFVVSLGGNDFLNYVRNLFNAGGMQALLDALGGEAEEEALAILERVLAIVESVRAVNPDADFVFLLYPDYPASNNWQSLIRANAGSLADAAITLIQNEFASIMRALADRLVGEELVAVDLYRQTMAEDIDPFLVDELHFTEFGHRRVAEEIFLSLGGVTVGDAELEQPYEVGVR